MNIFEAIQSWRDGLLSDSEILGFVLVFQYEVIESMRAKETEIADKGVACMFGKTEANV